MRLEHTHTTARHVVFFDLESSLTISDIININSLVG